MMSSEPSQAAPTQLPEGIWGAEQVQLTIDAAGNAKLQTDCADGSVQGPIRPDSAGHFALPGRFDARTPGPQAGDQFLDQANSRYVGRISNDVMQLTISTPDGKPVRSFSLKKGLKVKLIRCL